MCRDFTRKIEYFTLAGLSHSTDAELLDHQRACADCAGWLEQRQALAGAMQVLRSSTARMEAPVAVEREVLRAFRQSADAPVAPSKVLSLPRPSAFRRSGFFNWGYAAVAAGLAIALGLGVWFSQRPGTAASPSAQLPVASAPQLAKPSVAQPEKPAQVAAVETHAAAPTTLHRSVSAAPTAQGQPAVSSGLTQTAQAQGYTPLMLCDPLSCSGDEQVVRLELPTTAADGSASSQMADVIVGDDGLVRAIRIVPE